MRRGRSESRYDANRFPEYNGLGTYTDMICKVYIVS